MKEPMTTTDTRRTPTNARLSRFAKSLLDEWRRLELPAANAGVVVAVSGGADSTALLLALDEVVKRGKLNLKVTVAHLDHGLRGASRADAKWVRELAKSLGHEVVVGRANLKPTATTANENLEQAARKARYNFLLRTATAKKSIYVLTGHTADDQAETILMRLLRGSAAEGLSGTPALRQIKQGSKVMLARPLLGWARRSDTQAYCRQNRIDFRRDEMNEDETFSRVRVRKQLLPLMESFNSRVVQALNRTASLLSEDASALSEDADRLLELAASKPGKNSETGATALSVSVLLQKPAAVRRRALREWILRSRGDLNRLEMVHLMAVERLLEGERGGRVAELPGGMEVTRKRGMLELSRKKVLKKRRVTSKIRRG
jgi:tRNA(Ile)-lysidine synthase